MKWIHPEAGEVEVNPQDAADEGALFALGLKKISDAVNEEPPKRTRKVREEQ